MQIVIIQVHSKASEVQTKLSLWALEKIKSVIYLMKYSEQKSYLVLAWGYYLYLLLRAFWCTLEIPDGYGYILRKLVLGNSIVVSGISSAVTHSIWGTNKFLIFFRIFITQFLVVQPDLTCSSFWDLLTKRTSVTCDHLLRDKSQKVWKKKDSSAHKTLLYHDDTAMFWETPRSFFVGIIQDEIAAKPCLFGICCFWNKLLTLKERR